MRTVVTVGEYVPPGRPVIALLPPENVIVRFYVPQARLPSLAPGDTVDVHADGLEPGATARVRSVSSEAEFTPPVIYSKETRDKLVFLVEALPDAASVARLRPGQPLEVRLR